MLVLLRKSTLSNHDHIKMEIVEGTYIFTRALDGSHIVTLQFDGILAASDLFIELTDEEWQELIVECAKLVESDVVKTLRPKRVDR